MERAQPSSKLADLLRGAQVLQITVLLTAQSLCVAPADNGFFYGSSSSTIQVELFHRVRLPQPACALHRYAVPGFISHDSPAPSAPLLPHDMN
jgi:hypothetical protein